MESRTKLSSSTTAISGECSRKAPPAFYFNQVPKKAHQTPPPKCVEFPGSDDNNTAWKLQLPLNFSLADSNYLSCGSSRMQRKELPLRLNLY